MEEYALVMVQSLCMCRLSFFTGVHGHIRIEKLLLKTKACIEREMKSVIHTLKVVSRYIMMYIHCPVRKKICRKFALP